MLNWQLQGQLRLYRMEMVQNRLKIHHQNHTRTGILNASFFRIFNITDDWLYPMSNDILFWTIDWSLKLYPRNGIEISTYIDNRLRWLCLQLCWAGTRGRYPALILEFNDQLKTGETSSLVWVHRHTWDTSAWNNNKIKNNYLKKTWQIVT